MWQSLSMYIILTFMVDVNRYDKIVSTKFPSDNLTKDKIFVPFTDHRRLTIRGWRR